MATHKNQSRPLSPWEKGISADDRKIRTIRWLGGQLRQGNCRVPSPVCKRLDEEGHLGALLKSEDPNDLEERKKTFLKVARGFLADHRATTRRKSARKRRRPPTAQPASTERLSPFFQAELVLTPSELKRQRLLERELVRMAEAIPGHSGDPTTARAKGEMAKIREGLHLELPLSRDEARALIFSMGAGVFEREYFEKYEIPLVGHSCRFLNGLAPRVGYPIGITPETKIEFRWRNRSHVAVVGARAGKWCWEGRLHPLSWIYERSALGPLVAAAERLCSLFPWRSGDAAMFLLTGSAPPVRSISLERAYESVTAEHTSLRMTLSVHPWVSAETVLRAYRRMQRAVLGRRNVPPGDPSLEFFQFVSTLRHQGASYSEAMKAWTKKHSLERHRYPARDPDAVKRFINRFNDVARQILRPYEGGEIRPSPRKEVKP